MRRFSIVLLLLAAVGCSRQTPQENASPSQPPAAAPAASQSEAQPPADTTGPGAPKGDQPTPGEPKPSGQLAPEASREGPPPPPTAAAAAETAAAPPVPRFREITVAADTPLSITLESPIASDTSQVEDSVEGRLARSVVVSGTTVLPAGARVTGSVLDAKRSGRVKGRASVALRFDRVIVHGEPYHIQTARITREAASSTKSDVKKGGIGAGVGAVIGGIAGGGKGAAIGGVVGGAGTVMATRGKEVQLPAGTPLSTRLTSPLEVRVEVSDGVADKRRPPEP
jgi:hypothetical protein